MTNERILIVDSMAQHGAWVADNLLNPHGYQPRLVTDSRQGVTFALAQPPDLILLDDNVTPLTGWQMLQQLRQEGLKFSVILMVTPPSETISLEALRLGVKDCVTKPLIMTELLSTLERVLQPKRLQAGYQHLKQQLHESQQQNNHYRQQLHTLSSVSKLATMTPISPKFWASLAEAAAYLTQAEECLILWLNATTHTWSPMATWGVDERYFAKAEFDLTGTLAHEAISQGQPIMRAHPAVNQADLPYELQAVLYIPILAGSQVVGLLRVSNRHQTRPFEAHDSRLLAVLADYAAQLSQQQQNLQLMAEAEEKSNMTLQHLTEAVIITHGAEQQIRFVNQAGRTLFNLATETPASLSELLPDINGSTDDSSREITLSDRRTLKMTVTTLAEDEQLITFQDLTPIKQITARQNEFVTQLCQELGAPLSLLKNATQILNRYERLERGQQQLLMHQITESMGQVMQVVEDMLDMQQTENSFEAEKQLVDVDKVILKVVSRYQEEAEQQHKQLVYYRPKHAATVWGNSSHLAQMIRLLVENALAGTADRVAVLVQVQAEQVTVKVEDNGSPLSLTDQLIIFDKFFKANQPTHEHGLGLALCKSVIEKHQGQIWVQSQPHHGTSFTFTLPLATPRAEKRPIPHLRLLNGVMS